MTPQDADHLVKTLKYKTPLKPLILVIADLVIHRSLLRSNQVE